MRVLKVERAEPAEVFDASVCGTHAFTLANGVVVHNCYGKTCGVCDAGDLKIRRNYIAGIQNERHVKLEDVKVVDEKSRAVRVRCKITKNEKHRFVMNDHWRFAVRRAAFMAQEEVNASFRLTKRSVRLASDTVKYRDFTCGVDYMEIALTRQAPREEVAEFLRVMNANLLDFTIDTESFTMLGHNAAQLKSDIDLSLWEMEVQDEVTVVHRKLEEWARSDYVRMILKNDQGYGAMENEEVNAKDYCDDIWLARDGHKVKMKMLVRGRPSPYNIYAAVMGKASWIEAAKFPAWRIEAFVEGDENQIDFFRPVCQTTGKSIPCSILDKPFHPDYGPKELDRANGVLLADTAAMVGF